MYDTGRFRHTRSNQNKMLFHFYLWDLRVTHDKATRSYNMRRIKGRGIKPEKPLRKLLLVNGA